MLDWWNDVSLSLLDGVLGWLLLLPRWAAVVGVGLLTAVVLTLIRQWTTNQDRLCRAAADLRRLNELERAAKRANAHEARTRYQLTRSQISLIKLKAELLPLLAVLLPVAFLATWAFQRLGYHSPRADELIPIRVYLPVSAEDDVLHLVPQPDLFSVNGWVQPVRLEKNEPTWWDRLLARLTSEEAKPGDPDAVAIWQVKAAARLEPYRLQIRWKDQTLEHELLVGQTRYSPAQVVYPEAGEVQPGMPVTSEVRLRDVRLLGIPGWDPWLPAWLVGYLLVTIPLVPLLKRMLRIY